MGQHRHTAEPFTPATQVWSGSCTWLTSTQDIWPKAILSHLRQQRQTYHPPVSGMAVPGARRRDVGVAQGSMAALNPEQLGF